jgi:hypothetical protein
LKLSRKSLNTKKNNQQQTGGLVLVKNEDTDQTPQVFNKRQVASDDIFNMKLNGIYANTLMSPEAIAEYTDWYIDLLYLQEVLKGNAEPPTASSEITQLKDDNSNTDNSTLRKRAVTFSESPAQVKNVDKYIKKMESQIKESFAETAVPVQQVVSQTSLFAQAQRIDDSEIRQVVRSNRPEVLFETKDIKPARKVPKKVFEKVEPKLEDSQREKLVFIFHFFLRNLPERGDRIEMEKPLLNTLLKYSETDTMKLIANIYNELILPTRESLAKQYRTVLQQYNKETNPERKEELQALGFDMIEYINVYDSQRTNFISLKSKGLYQYLKDDFFQKLDTAENTAELMEVGRLSEILTMISGSESLDGRNFYGMELFDIKASKLHQYPEDSTDGNDISDDDSNENDKPSGDDADEKEDISYLEFKINNANAFKRKCLKALLTPVDQVSNEIQRLIHAYGDRESLNGEFADNLATLLSANYDVLSTLTGDQLQSAKRIYKRIMKLLINCKSTNGYGKDVSDLISVLVGNPKTGVEGLLQEADLDRKLLQYREYINSNLSPSTTTGKFKPVKKPYYIGKKPSLKKPALKQPALKQPALKRPALKRPT